MNDPIIPLFNSADILEKKLKLAKESGAYGQDLEYFLTIEFLLSYKGSKDTFATYRSELEKLFLWTRLVAKKTIKSLARYEIEDFIEFCKKPPLSWIRSNIAFRFLKQEGGEFVPNPNWRPFQSRSESAYKLLDSGIKVLFGVLNSYFGFLIQEEYLSVNPVMQIRQKKRFLRSRQELPRIRRISNIAKDYLIAEAQKMAEENPKTHERTLFIIKALLAMYLRISELTENERWIPKMKDFYKDSEDRWWFYTVGKGNKEGEISVSDEILNALKRYRIHLGLPPFPSRDDDSPLIQNHINANAGITSTRQIRGIVQKCYDRTIASLIKDEKTDDARHSSSVITDRYVDISKADRHRSAKDKRI